MMKAPFHHHHHHHHHLVDVLPKQQQKPKTLALKNKIKVHFEDMWASFRKFDSAKDVISDASLKEIISDGQEPLTIIGNRSLAIFVTKDITREQRFSNANANIRIQA
ncbi:hypothetical protein BGZ94_003760 [Podila epigama]|nr:hypothetical protein BGZ94_003760 [Podila epigama]